MIFSIAEYKDSLLFDDAFKTQTQLVPIKDDDDEFVFSSGRNSVVFKMFDKQTKRHKALKCFINVSDEQLENVKKVSDYLQYIKSPYIVPYKYCEEELWVTSGDESEYYPVLVMEWAEGESMGNYLKRICLLEDSHKIKDLALAFDQMAYWLLQQDFAHGDLKLDNIIINEEGQPVLVDYDGCFIPGMENQLALELGTPGYQHPLRNEDFFNKHIDHISILVISTALHALVQKPELWIKYDNGENLLFTNKDLINIQESFLCSELFDLDNEQINLRFALLQNGLSKLRPIIGINDAIKISQQTILFYNKLIESINNNEQLIPYRKGDKWGFVNKQKNIIIPLVYDSAERFSDDKLRVEQNGDTYIINKNGKILFTCNHDILGSFHNGFARVEKNEKVGFINDFGEEKIECKYDDATSLNNGLFKVKLNNKWGLITNNYKEITPFIFDELFDFYEDLSLVKIDNKFGFIDKFGNEIIHCKYDEVYYNLNESKYFSDGLFQVKINTKWGFINKFGDNIIPFINDDARFFSEGLAAVKRNGNWRIIDINGTEMFTCICNDIGSYSEGLVIFELNDKYGFIDKNNKIVIPCIYEEAEYFHCGLVKVMLNDKYGFVNKVGEIIIPFIYNDTRAFINNFADVKINNKWGIINEFGKVIIPIKFDEIFESDEFLYIVSIDNKIGFIDRMGNEYFED